MTNPLTPAGIESATFRFVAQYLNHCATGVPSYSCSKSKKRKFDNSSLYKIFVKRRIFKPAGMIHINTGQTDFIFKYFHVIRHGQTRTLHFRLSFPYGIVCRLFTGSGTSGTKRQTASLRILVDRPKENHSIPVKKSAFLSRKQSCSARQKLPKSPTKHCHYLTHCLHCALSFMHRNARCQSILNGIIATTCHCQRRIAHN